MSIPRKTYALCLAAVCIGPAAVLACSRSSRLPARSLETVADRVVSALHRKDWNAFRRECAPIIACTSYSAARPGDLPNGVYDKIFGSSASRSDRWTMYVSSDLINTDEPLKSSDRSFFRDFCKYTQRNFLGKTIPENRGSVDRIEVSKNLHDDDEARFLFGPAIRGRIASNAEWRIQMEEIDGEWRVRSLIFAAH
jgi:hypothetical protein